MQEPIDYSRVHWPAKTKYIDEETPSFARWNTMGSWGANPDLTTVFSSAGGNDDIIVAIPKDKAEALVAARDRFCNEVLAILNGAPV